MTTLTDQRSLMDIDNKRTLRGSSGLAVREEGEGATELRQSFATPHAGFGRPSAPNHQTDAVSFENDPEVRWRRASKPPFSSPEDRENPRDRLGMLPTVRRPGGTRSKPSTPRAPR